MSSRLYLLFVYKNDVAVNQMGIKGTLTELFKEAEKMTLQIYEEDLKAEVKTKLVYWD